MSRNTKIVAGMVGALLLLCVCGAVITMSALGSLGIAFGRAVEMNPVQVHEAASRIADFQVPSGFQPEVTIDLGGFMFVAYTGTDPHSHIMLIQAPASAGMDRAALENALQQAASSRGYDKQTRTQIVGQQEAIVRGQNVTLLVSEGTSSDGVAYRILTGFFGGKGGTAMLSIVAPISSWNQGEVDAFIASIH